MFLLNRFKLETVKDKNLHNKKKSYFWSISNFVLLYFYYINESILPIPIFLEGLRVLKRVSPDLTKSC